MTMDPTSLPVMQWSKKPWSPYAVPSQHNPTLIGHNVLILFLVNFATSIINNQNRSYRTSVRIVCTGRLNHAWAKAKETKQKEKALLI